MIASMIGLIITSISSTNAQSTIGKDCPNFQPCLDDGDIYKTATCDPLQSSNVTWYNTCLCLNNINIGLCYYQCTSDPDAVSQGLAFQATITASCAAVNINPNGPLPPAPWVSTPVTPTTATGAGAGAGTGATPAATSTTAATNNAQKLMSSLAGLIVIFFA